MIKEMKTVEIDGNKFNNLEEFYTEIENKFCKDFKMGRNLDAVDDVLRGGFGIFEYDENIKLTWNNSEKSKNILGYSETVKFYNKALLLTLLDFHFSNIKWILKKRAESKSQEGPTLFDMILKIMKDHKHIQLIMK